MKPRERLPPEVRAEGVPFAESLELPAVAPVNTLHGVEVDAADGGEACHRLTYHVVAEGLERCSGRSA
jgi:hypothetical protein